MKLIEQLKLFHRAYLYKHKYDKGGIAYINNVIQKGQTVLDIGAHKGGYLYFMLQRVGKNGHVITFEPQATLFRYIKKIKALFNWDNVTVEHLALSDAAGTVTLYIPTNKIRNNSSPGASIVAHQTHAEIGTTEEVTTVTLDTYCIQNKIEPAFLKIDVEGNELKIFEGGRETLKKYKPKIIVEIEARFIGPEKVWETFAFLESLGYTGKIVHGLHHIPLSDFSIEKYQNQTDNKNYCNNFIFE